MATWSRKLNLHDIRSPSFELALQIVKAVSSNVSTPHDAALITLLFGQLQERADLMRLGDQLCSEAAAFIVQSPRDQPNQAGKVLKAACCIYSKSFVGKSLDGHLKGDFEEYINYAANQGWLNDPFLAFYCHHLIDVIPTSQTTIEFFEKSYGLYIERRNIAAIAQSLLVLGDSISAVERSRCYQVLERNWEALSVRDSAWSLLALSKSPDPDTEIISHQISYKLTEYLSGRIATLARAINLLDLLTLMGGEIPQPKLDQVVKSLQPRVELQKQNDVFLIHLPVNKDSSATVDLSTLVLSLLAVQSSGFNEITGVYAAQRDALDSIVKEAEELSGKTAIAPFELLVANVLTVLSTVLIGLIMFGFFMNAVIYPPQIDFSQTDLRDVDGWTVGLVFIVLLITQLRALITGNSAITYWLQLTPFKQLSGFVRDVTSRFSNRS